MTLPRLGAVIKYGWYVYSVFIKQYETFIQIKLNLSPHWVYNKTVASTQLMKSKSATDINVRILRSQPRLRLPGTHQLQFWNQTHQVRRIFVYILNYTIKNIEFSIHISLFNK